MPALRPTPKTLAPVAQLKAAGCATICREKMTGTPAERRQLKKLMGKLASGDVVVIPAVDRLSRDATDLQVIARDMQRAGAGLRSIAEPVVDTTSDFAELIFAMFGVAAKLERRRIMERTVRGRADAKAKGAKFGRKPILTSHQQQGDEFAPCPPLPLNETSRIIRTGHPGRRNIADGGRYSGRDSAAASAACLCYEEHVDRQDIIARLRENQAALKQRGVAHAALFGSRARGDARPDSDTDIMIEINPEARIGVYEYVGLKEYIASLFDGPIDVVNRDSLKPYVKPAATADAIYAF